MADERRLLSPLWVDRGCHVVLTHGVLLFQLKPIYVHAARFSALRIGSVDLFAMYGEGVLGMYCWDI